MSKADHEHKMLKYKLILFVFCLLFLFSGCNTRGGDATDLNIDESKGNNQAVLATDEKGKLNKDEVYYTVGMHINVPYWQAHKRGLEVAAAELSVRAVFTGETGNDPAKQIDIFEQVLKKDPAGILVSPLDPEGMTASINKAIEAGIPVICIDTDAPKSKRLCYFGTNNYDAGWAAAEILSKAIGERGDVGILTIPGVFSIDERTEGFKDCIMKNYPDVKIVSVQSDEANPSKAAEVTSQMIRANPSLRGIFGGNSISGVGAAAALREVNKTGIIKIVSMDRDDATLELVEQGVIEATIVQRTFTMSYYAMKFLYDYNHDRVKMANDITGINPLPQHVDTGVIVVDKSNVAKFR